MISCSDDKGGDESKKTDDAANSDIPYEELCACMSAEAPEEDCEELMNSMDDIFMKMSDDERAEFQTKIADCMVDMSDIDMDDIDAETDGPEIGAVSSAEEFEERCKALYKEEMNKNMTDEVSEEELDLATEILDSYCSCSREQFEANGFDFSEGNEITSQDLMVNTSSCIEDMMSSLQELYQMSAQ